MYKDSVVIIGNDHHNTLGLIRSIGCKNIPIYLIVLTQKKKAFITKSKYITEYYLSRDEDECLKQIKMLKDYFKSKSLILTSCDSAALFVDKNKDFLKKHFIISLAATKYGGIQNLMDKNITNRLAAECGFNLPKTWCVTKQTYSDFEANIVPKIHFKCIIKPYMSVKGSKDEIIICESKEELCYNIQLLLTTIDSIQVQQFIDKDYEMSVLGCATKSGKVITPGIIRKIREYPFNMGSSSFSVMKPELQNYINKEQIKQFVKKIDYNGLFSIEFVVKNDKLFFLEINLRNDGNGYVPIADNVNLPYIYYLDSIGREIADEKKEIKKSIYFMIEINDIKYMLKKPLSPVKWLKSLFKTDCFLLWSKKDIKPFIYKFIYG